MGRVTYADWRRWARTRTEVIEARTVGERVAAAVVFLGAELALPPGVTGLFRESWPESPWPHRVKVSNGGGWWWAVCTDAVCGWAALGGARSYADVLEAANRHAAERQMEGAPRRWVEAMG